MSAETASVVKQACSECGNDRSRMMDIVIAVQKKLGCVSSEAVDLIAKETGANRVEVESVVSFYAFFSNDQKGKIAIRLCNDVVDKMMGVDEIAAAFTKELGIEFGQITEDGQFSLEWTPCIGMCDQAPAAMVNDEIVTNLTVDKVGAIVKELKGSGDPKKLVTETGDGNNSHQLVRSMVKNNIFKTGSLIFADHAIESGLKKAVEMTPDEVIGEVKAANVRGRGGAGFPTGLKWQFTRSAEGSEKYIVCNADEGEPGTFKDRVLLTEKADLLFEGMTIAGYAIGAANGILYLRGEYAYLLSFLNKVLQDRRDAGLLGQNVCGKEGFNYDIRIQLGAGAYICGEESALLSSCEGLRGDPKTRPPFPAQKGYLGKPTSVNNVETFCCVSRVLEMGAAWFEGQGSKASPGFKLFSICGDCAKPGVYELPFGTTISQMLEEVGAEDTQAVLVGGPSGRIVNPEQFGRQLCFDDLGTGGAVIIYGNGRDLLDVVHQYMEFFIEESCGFCTPCRVGNVLMAKCLENILEGKGQPGDIDYLSELGRSIKFSSRCGLGQTSPNPVLTTIENFRGLYEAKMKEHEKGMVPSFDIKAALATAEGIAERKSVIFG